MSTFCISQSAMRAGAACAAFAAPRFARHAMSQSFHRAFERMDSTSAMHAMCRMHMANKAMYAALSMSMAATGIMTLRTDVSTSVSLFVLDILSIVFVILLVVSLLLVSLVVLISLITILLTCLTGQQMLDSLVGHSERVVGLASIDMYSTQGD